MPAAMISNPGERVAADDHEHYSGAQWPGRSGDCAQYAGVADPRDACGSRQER
jgi:hypothetical protein